MDTYRATIYIVIINLIVFCFSTQAWASRQFEKQQQLNENKVAYTSLPNPIHRTTTYLWLENQQLNQQAHDALAFIASSSRHGLSPDDYHFNLLQQLRSTTNEPGAQRFNLLLTDGLLKLIHDIAVGRLDPAVVDPKWSIPRAPFDAADFLQFALQLDDFKASLNTLIPTSIQYHQLKDAGIRYQAYVDRGSWPVIPEIPVLHVGDFHQNIPLIRQRLAFEDNTLAPVTSRFYDKKMEQAVKHFQRRHSLKADGIIGSATRRAMNISAIQRLQQIKVNLERLRWLPDDLGKRYIMVNLANYRLTAIDNNQTKLDMRVIVGKKQRPTPSFASKMTHVVLNPHWYVPNKLARLDLLPKQQSNPDYFEHYNFRVFNDINGKRTEIDPGLIDWQSISQQYFPYSLIQDPGEKNSLGRLKFILPNPWSIYLHDTPTKSLFSKTSRNFSSGCIRVEDPLALANFSLAGNSKQQTLLDLISSKKSYSTKLEQPLTVYTIYSTVWLDGNEIMFSPDVYNRDQKMAQYL